MAALTRHLKEEQELIKEGLGLLSSFQRRLEAGKKVPPTELRAVLFVLNWVSESCHINKEEKVLLSALQQKMNQEQIQEISIKEEMAQVQTAHLRLRMAVEDYEINSDSAPKLATRMDAYRIALNNLIEKETDVLYKKADELIKENEQIELLKLSREIQKQSGLNDLSSIRNLLSQVRDTISQTVA